ncbi:MAG TPA: thiamine phosphate synthase [Verrucomicrobiae bacterium]|nr:thiamine phosphate synthase [Verrucomicrobiae bacterium]
MPTKLLSDCRLYGFIDTAYLENRDAAAVARELIDGGADVIQVRAKKSSHAQRVEIGLKVVSVAAEAEVPVIINDDVDAAFESGADGLHLGQEDWEHLGGRAERAERLANMRIVGLSTHSLEQALRAERDGVDYIGVGPVFPTATKPGTKAVGVELIRKVAEGIKIPFFAIGGITPENVGEVLSAGATRVAVVSALLRTSDVRSATAAFKRRLELAR